MTSLKKYRTVLVLGASIAAFFLWVSLFYQPTYKEIELSRSQIVQLDRDVDNARQYLTATAQSMEGDSWMRQRQSLLSNLTRIDSLENFVDRLTADFSSFGITQAEFAPDLHELLKQSHLPLGNVVLTSGRFEARCEGRFLSFGKAVEHLEKQPYFADLHSLTISYNEATNPNVLCAMNFSVYLREPEERHD